MKVYKFYSPTCGPCKVLEKNLQESGIEYESIDITKEESDELVAKYSIMSIPTLIGVGDNGESILRHKGIMSTDDIIKYFK
jgi:thiol-disulfide isomerase/thioredoxin